MQYYEIRVEIESNIKPPYFIGSTIRGSFGYALKKVTCINPKFNCTDCFAKDECLYYDFFEKQNGYHKYRFDITLGGENFNFGLYLFDSASLRVAFILSSIEKMLKEVGLTKDRYKFNKFYIYLNNTLIYDGEFRSLKLSPKKIYFPPNYPSNIKIDILSPIRIKKNNRLLRENIELEDILTSIYKRKEKIFNNKETFKLPYTPTYRVSLKKLTHKRLNRRSNRQNTKMGMDGIVGEIFIMDIDRKSFELLKVGEIIGVGKQCVFGLGKIKIEKIQKIDKL